jgi:beta-lactamase regulating signal transducer with metallopeptidase domain
MTSFTLWHPGESIIIVALEILLAITLVASLAWILDRARGHRSAAFSKSLWLAALLAITLSPAIVVFGPKIPLPFTLMPNETSTPQSAAQQEDNDEPPPRIAGTLLKPVSEHRGESIDEGWVGQKQKGASSAPLTAGPVQLAITARSSSSQLSLNHLAGIVFFLWGLGSFFCGLRLVHGLWRIRQLTGTAKPLEDPPWASLSQSLAQKLRISRIPDVRQSATIRCPLVAGLFRPCTVLPEEFVKGCSRAELRDVLIHEWAHIAQLDPCVRLLQQLNIIVFWFHPLVHLVNHRLAEACEDACDDQVLAHEDPRSYAETLLKVAKYCYPQAGEAGYLCMIPPHSNLERRIARLFASDRDKSLRLGTRNRVIVLIWSLLFGLVLSIDLRATAQNPAINAMPDLQAVALDQPQTDVSNPAVCSVHGTVLAGDSGPAVGATVWAASLSIGSLERHETIADAKGRYELRVRPGDWFIQGTRGTQGGECGQVHVFSGSSPKPVNIRMEERGTFRGKLLEAETGKPIRGGRLFFDTGLVLTTNDDGAVETGGLSRTNHEAFVGAPGRMHMRVLFDTTARANTELEVQVPRVGKISGRVTDEQGKPIPGAYVGRATSGHPLSTNSLYLPCDSEGRFICDDSVPADETTRLQACAPGYTDQIKSGVSVSPDAAPLELSFRLRPKPGTLDNSRLPADQRWRTISGTVRAHDKKSVARAVVRWGYMPFVGALEATSDIDGRFRLAVPASSGVLAIVPRGFPPAFRDIVAGGDQTLDIRLESGHVVRGRVVDEKGKSLSGVSILGTVRCPDRLCPEMDLLPEPVFADLNGGFELRGVPDSTVYYFFKEGMDSVSTNLKFDDLNRITMHEGGAILGKLIDQSDKPIINFRILVSPARPQVAGDPPGSYFAGYSGFGVRYTSADGTFVLSGVKAGSFCRITALSPGHEAAVLDRVLAIPTSSISSERPVLMRAGPAPSFRTRVLDDSGKPLSNAHVTLVYLEPRPDLTFVWGMNDAGWWAMEHARTASDGWANFPTLGFDEATVLVRAPGYARTHVGWRNGDKDPIVQLAPEAVLRGRIQDEDGNDLQGHINLITPFWGLPGPLPPGAGGPRHGLQVSARIGPDDKGCFRIAELPAGPCRVTVRGSDGFSTLHRKQIELKAGETTYLGFGGKKE